MAIQENERAYWEEWHKEQRRARDRARHNTDEHRTRRRERYASDQAHRERVLEKNRRYSADNAVELAAKARTRRKADPEKTRENELRYREKRKLKHREEAKEYYTKNRETVLAKKRAKTAAEHATRPAQPPRLTNQQQCALRLKRLQDAQAGRSKPHICEICGDGRRIVFDHCHQSGRFRGWICQLCNVALGAARENVQVLHKLIEYIERSKRQNKGSTIKSNSIYGPASN